MAKSRDRSFGTIGTCTSHIKNPAFVMVKDNVTNLDAEVRPYWEDVAERELGETAEVKRKCLAEIRVLISDDSLLRCPTDDAFLLKFLRVRKYRVTDAFRTIRCYFRVRKEHPEIFKDLRPDSFSYDSLVRKHRLIFYLKERDSLGRAVCCLRLGMLSPTSQRALLCQLSTSS